MTWREFIDLINGIDENGDVLDAEAYAYDATSGRDVPIEDLGICVHDEGYPCVACVDFGK